MVPGVDTRSFNMSPVYFVYPDGPLDKAGAEQLVASLDLAGQMEETTGVSSS